MGELRVHVKDTLGVSVPGAVVSFGGVTELQADVDGMVRLEWNPALRFPMLVEARAGGFRPGAQLAQYPDRYGIVIHLFPAPSAAPAGSKTVSAQELAPGSHQLAAQLHEQAIKALRQSDYSGAERLLFQALALAPSSVSIHNNLGVVFLRRGEPETASLHFARAAELAPEDPNTLGHLGLVRWVQRNYDESFRLLEKAIGRGFENAPGYYFFGILALQRGLDKEAIKFLSALDEHRFRYRNLFLAVALSRAGKSQEAAKMLRQFRAANPAPFM